MPCWNTSCKQESSLSVTSKVLPDCNAGLRCQSHVGYLAMTLSIAPLIQKGGMFETGAGGSAPNANISDIEATTVEKEVLGVFEETADEGVGSTLRCPDTDGSVHGSMNVSSALLHEIGVIKLHWLV